MRSMPDKLQLRARARRALRPALAVLVLAPGLDPARGDGPDAVTLPEGVAAVWDAGAAYRETTPARERISINGLWRWQPADAGAERVPAGDWGFFKVPGAWPGITDYMQKDAQTVYAHPAWRETRLDAVSAAWYEREVSVPEAWAGRHITVCLEYLNSYAALFVDGVKLGEIRFPGGMLDITGACRPGRTHRLSLLVAAMPLEGVILSYTDSAAAREVRGAVARRGLCGDAYIAGIPAGPRIADVRVETSVRRRTLAIDVALERLAQEAGPYTLRATVRQEGAVARRFASAPFRGDDLKDGRFHIVESWMPERLWDLHTPRNMCELEVALTDGRGRLLDVSWPTRFGFREFWIDGRDFVLNGSRIFLSAVPLDNAQVSAALANYAAARESLDRLKSFGINFVYTHNYGCEPGAHLGFGEILRAADDAGMLVGFSQPHFSHYDWRAPGADRDNGYARHAEFYVRAAQNHPSVVMYSMSHNATGYNDDMNPDMIDGVQDARDSWASRNVELARRAEAIVTRLDPGRIVYHHASGNLGPLHAVNFYPNFAPIQELSDWFEHWAVAGVKPVFLCEYGAPFTWDWTMYRGWYQGEREFGSARVPWEFCLAEWNAQFLGDRAFPSSDPEKANLRWEAEQFRAGRLWHRWDYPHQVGSTAFDERYPVFAAYITDNWRAFRTRGVSATSPWEHGHFWKLGDGVDRGRVSLPVDWARLQRPGFSPDYIQGRYERMDLAFDRADWIATPAAQALYRNNLPLLAYIGGKPAQFTSKDHIFYPGETFEKQILVLNNSRETVTAEARWTLGIAEPLSGEALVTVPTGQQEAVPLRLVLPAALAPGRYELRASVRFDTGMAQDDSFAIDVLPRPAPVRIEAKIALHDPRGETAAWLDRLGVRHEIVTAAADLAAYDLLIIGKGALAADAPAPDVRRVRDGLKVVLFEQTAEVLERRLGFRVAEYGLRQLFPRAPDHPILAGLDPEHLRDWRGEATTTAPRLTVEMRPRHGPTVEWCGIPVTRLWRCGNRGNVASVLIEKPARGDFMPILDGGYGLQYSPLLEYREGRGMMLFCQLDVTGRTEEDPAAAALARSILEHAAAWRPAPRRECFYAGEPDGMRHLTAAGVTAAEWDGGPLPDGALLVVAPGVRSRLEEGRAALAAWLARGGSVLALGLDQEDAGALPGEPVTVRRAEHISTGFEPLGVGSRLAGVGPADVHCRDPRDLPLVTAGARPLGNGVLAARDDDSIVFCQLVPWQFDATKQMNLKRTYRRVSFLVSRLMANLGVAGSTPLLDRVCQPVEAAASETRWREGLYLDAPEEWDDPYRFFRW